MLVRISKRGLALLDNKDLANRVLSAIIKGKDKFQHGEPITVEGSNLSVEMVTSILILRMTGEELVFKQP